MAKPSLETIPSFYHSYVNRVQEEDVPSALSTQSANLFSFLEAIPEDKWDHRYAEGKWSIKEMVQHMIDAERIFTYRALCIARGEKQSLPGFDENEYAASSAADSRKKSDLLDEFRVVRQSTEALFRSFNEKQLRKSGMANNKSIAVDAIGFIIAGHVSHHLAILQERYL